MSRSYKMGYPYIDYQNKIKPANYRVNYFTGFVQFYFNEIPNLCKRKKRVWNKCESINIFKKKTTGDLKIFTFFNDNKMNRSINLYSFIRHRF